MCRVAADAEVGIEGVGYIRRPGGQLADPDGAPPQWRLARGQPLLPECRGPGPEAGVVRVLASARGERAGKDERRCAEGDGPEQVSTGNILVGLDVAPRWEMS